MAHIVLIRGLNTYGDDHMRLGPLDWGPVYEPLKSSLEKRGHTVFSIYGMGYQTLTHQVEVAEKELEKYFARSSIKTPVHILAHSVGGLVARQLVYRPSMRNIIKSITTLGTPHQGTRLPQLSERLIHSKGVVFKSLRLMKFDLSKKLKIYEQFSFEALERFNKVHSDLIDIDYRSIVGQTPLPYLSWPYRVSHHWMKPYVGETSDGFISSASQKWGQVLANTYLDHLGQTGFFLQMNPARRAECQREFQRILDVVDLYWQTSS